MSLDGYAIESTTDEYQNLLNLCNQWRGFNHQVEVVRSSEIMLFIKYCDSNRHSVQTKWEGESWNHDFRTKCL